MSLIGKFYRQLKLRGVVRAAIAYAVGAWALVEFSGVLADAFSAPDWLMPVLIGLVIVGLPIVLAFSWFFDITPDGIRRTQTVEEVVPNAVFDRRVTFVVISLLLAALLLSVYGNFRQAPEPPESMSILIADFENEAGNELFSGIIEESLRVGLEVAPFVSTFSRKRAADIAGVGGALPLEAAGIVALREGINIAIGGTISRDGGELIVSASGFAPGDSTERFTVIKRAKTDADILNVVAQIAKALRLELGDTQKPIGAGEAESFVVANLEAASEYLKAQDLQFSRKLEEAVVHYEKAIEFDPKFARAYAGLALTELYLGRTESASKHWELALAGLNTLTERGQLRTLGNYYFSN
ncbi:MAG: tetratricopeptide repeat protein, partial [Woeseiaceae bacterium]